MEYSTDDVAAARSLQFAKYMYTSMVTFWIYDYACSLHEEWTFLLRSNWSKTKCLYIVTKYLPFIFIITGLYMSFTPNENPVKCGMLVNITSVLGMIAATCADCFFIIRTYVFWNKNKILLAAIVVTYLLCLVGSVSIIVDATASVAYVTSPIPSITGCYQSSTSDRMFIPFVLFSVFGLGLMILTLIRAIQSWWRNTSRLYIVLMNHNILYYACVFLFSIMNIFTSLLLQETYQTVLDGIQFIALATVATRMHIHLWQTNQRSRGSTSDFVHIPLSDISSADVTV
ncbi:uncharacterized protein F5891DRAFT_1281011 [Suillus fuscotomentosus]|uniref:DUF6533 domain-containing protein n=1 Tax=Suillus fuscotomentosus TaxID=1912939 RepID=A0AAD4DZS6_9AGAM|nr:uncharacterized protein F5891DRAFT_1281011 [Suillus fuscotomentosus]KAG1895638.1 hypothetical protein F5891DRAFT_1281011 [Suillus fuscotomentosus]